eukprot:Skav234448  [mRNA]  locus=scaffold1647:72683:74696:+ [translate_table: standard]
MAHFFEMEARKDEVVKNFFARTQDASDHLPSEVAAVTKIQSVHRATQIRIIYHEVVAAARLIQRMVRGCLGRKKAREVSRERSNHLRLKFFHHCAPASAPVEKRGEWTKEYLSQEHKDLRMATRNALQCLAQSGFSPAAETATHQPFRDFWILRVRMSAIFLESIGEA